MDEQLIHDLPKMRSMRIHPQTIYNQDWRSFTLAPMPFRRMMRLKRLITKFPVFNSFLCVCHNLLRLSGGMVNFVLDMLFFAVTSSK